MAHDRSEVHLAAELSAPSPREIESTVFRILIGGDFSGRSPGGAPAATPATTDAGFTALVSPRDDDTIIIPRIQSVATPPRPLAIPVSSG